MRSRGCSSACGSCSHSDSRSRSFRPISLRADAFRQLLSELANRPHAEGWHAIVAGALDDPSLRLGSGIRARAASATRRAASSNGCPTVPAGAGPRSRATASWLRWIPTTPSRRTPNSSTPPPLRLCWPSKRGREEGQLRASQARALAAADAERRRIGRDLHDSAQQRLVALRVHLTLAGERLQPEEQPRRAARAGARRGARRAAERRARLYPQVLAQHGVAAALRSAARTAAIPVSVTDEGLRRHSGQVELSRLFLLPRSAPERGEACGTGGGGLDLALQR